MSVGLSSELAGETLSPAVVPAHGVFCFNGDAYQANDVLAIIRCDDEIQVQLRGIQEKIVYHVDEEEVEKVEKLWCLGVERWCAALLASRGIVQ